VETVAQPVLATVTDTASTLTHDVAAQSRRRATAQPVLATVTDTTAQ